MAPRYSYLYEWESGYRRGLELVSLKDKVLKIGSDEFTLTPLKGDADEFARLPKAFRLPGS